MRNIAVFYDKINVKSQLCNFFYTTISISELLLFKDIKRTFHCRYNNKQIIFHFSLISKDISSLALYNVRIESMTLYNNYRFPLI